MRKWSMRISTDETISCKSLIPRFTYLYKTGSVTIRTVEAGLKVSTLYGKLIAVAGEAEECIILDRVGLKFLSLFKTDNHFLHNYKYFCVVHRLKN